MFKSLYHYLLSLVSHPRATWVLAFMSFLEAFVSPLSPLIMLIPMAAAQPQFAWRYVNIASLAASCGSALGYLIGYEFITLVLPYIEQLGYLNAYSDAMRWFDEWGLWMVFISSLTPLPFKVFTVAAGALALDFIPFLVIAIIGRWLHFALVPIGLTYFAVPMQRWFRKKFITE